MRRSAPHHIMLAISQASCRLVVRHAVCIMHRSSAAYLYESASYCSCFCVTHAHAPITRAGRSEARSAPKQLRSSSCRLLHHRRPTRVSRTLTVSVWLLLMMPHAHAPINMYYAYQHEEYHGLLAKNKEHPFYQRNSSAMMSHW